jgi:hypothetical protein
MRPEALNFPFGKSLFDLASMTHIDPNSNDIFPVFPVFSSIKACEVSRYRHNSRSLTRLTKMTQTTVGWKEWVAVSGLELPPLKAKIDTGAKTSCLHALNIKPITERGEPWVTFVTQPSVRKHPERIIECAAPIADIRSVTNSGGTSELRYTIHTTITMGDWSDDVEITLTGREKMRYRMLIGRQTLEKGNFLVNSADSYLLGKLRKK